MSEGLADTPKPPAAPAGLPAHIHFWWLVLWTAVFSVPLALIQMISHPFDPTATNFKRWAGLWSRLCLLFGGIRIRSHSGATLEPMQPYVFVSNHQSALDIWSNLVGIDHAFGFVAKESLRRVPVVGHALRYSACLFVDRSTARKAVQSLNEAADRIRAGNSVMIYPEGRRTWSPQTDEFMKGAFQLAVKAGVPIVPVALMNAYELVDERRRASRPGIVSMVVGDPIDTTAIPLSGVPELISITRTWIQGSLDRYHAGEAPPFKTDAGSVSSPVQ